MTESPSPGERGADPRPLLGEPLALDLLNTHWIEGGELQDLLATPAGLSIWLRSAQVTAEPPITGEPPITSEPPITGEPLRQALRRTRDIVQAVAERPDSPSARADLNDLLARGRRERRLAGNGPVARVVVPDRVWTLPWLVAENYLDLLERAPDRIRRCEHPQCVLWYFDTSRAGTRRWCSMSICGNRSKATRHYRRRTETGADLR